MDMRTDLIAVPHAGLGFQFLRVPVWTIGAWSVCQEEVKAKKPEAHETTNESNKVDVVPLKSALLRFLA